jgi:hypothetical protein
MLPDARRDDGAFRHHDMALEAPNIERLCRGIEAERIAEGSNFIE